jgi:hypothetical protein
MRMKMSVIMRKTCGSQDSDSRDGGKRITMRFQEIGHGKGLERDSTDDRCRVLPMRVISATTVLPRRSRCHTGTRTTMAGAQARNRSFGGYNLSLILLCSPLLAALAAAFNGQATNTNCRHGTHLWQKE